MTSLDGQSLDGQSVPPTVATAPAASAAPAAPIDALARPDARVADTAVRAIPKTTQRAFGAPLAASVVGLVVATATLFSNSADAYVVPSTGLIALALLLPLIDGSSRTSRWDRGGLRLLGIAAAMIVGLLLLPQYLYGGEVNGVIHRSALSGPLLLVFSGATMSYSIRRLLGSTPSAQDVSLYPVFALPVALALIAYGLLLGKVLVQGAGGLSLDLIVTPWSETSVGLRNHIIGTLLLMVMTCTFSLLPGIGAGVFLSEYPGRLANVIGFSTKMLRAMSVFIIGVAALTFVELANGLPAASGLSRLLRGSFSLTDGGAIQPGSGSFVTAALFLSLLVIPVIAKLTEEGLRSVPRDIREGSIAIGATDGYGLRRILVPWAAPNIVTGLLLGAAEAAGSLAIIMFIAGDGEYGVGPLSSVTSLDYALFSTRYGSQSFIQTMGYRAPTDYGYSAALLLLFITLGLTVLALVLRSRFARRYRGSLTIG